MKYLLYLLIIGIFWGCSPKKEMEIKEIIETSSGTETKFITKYDKAGNLIHWEYDYGIYGPSDEIKKYQYERNNLMKMEWFFRKGNDTKLYMTDYYMYNQDNTVKSKIRKNRNDKLYWEFKYNYKTIDKGKELIINQYDNSGELLQEWLTIYDKDGRKTQEPTEFQETIQGSKKYEYVDETNVKITYLTLDNEIESEEYKKIDKQGNFKTEISDSEKNNYKYDENGNWIEKKVENKYETWTEYRAITYY